uniref:Uncharacterized protein n=1 Tax=Siphoviridae sp. ctC4e1 TaxID=2825375 RepID=A0A8S5VHT5_9CAUD|nr:MAG TPA: hypothetical protein [Siphoviridae sp. ctC4e1]
MILSSLNLMLELFDPIMEVLISRVLKVCLSRILLFPLYGYRLGFIFSPPYYLIHYRYLV